MPPTLSRAQIRPGDRICAAVSGGADSVAMLLLLHETNALPRNALGVGLSAVHVHHGLRGEEADADLAFVEALCLRLEVPLHIEQVSVPERIAQSRAAGGPETTEEAARALRYEVFARLLAEGHADSVLTAHTLDDQAETVLMKLLRGAWTEGLSGIAPVVPLADLPHLKSEMWGTRSPHGTGNREQSRAGNILRPVLSARRKELEDYLRVRGQPWRTDSSNADEAFTRNRIRHHLMPILREYNPAIDTALANLATLACEDEARWQADLVRILPQLLLPGKPVRGGGRAVATAPDQAVCVSLELDRLRSLDPALRSRVVRAAARSLGVRLSFDDTARLLAVAGVNPDSDLSAEAPPFAKARLAARLDLPDGLRAQRTARELQLTRAG
ncbi:MAG TPA: tRNA lysidine(34) synthetase TilS [Acidobacteriaceae bacterium]|nr:tRNA lysidine(34) synthetase TilS [Acidobacteriaceae bacterium]